MATLPFCNIPTIRRSYVRQPKCQSPFPSQPRTTTDGLSPFTALPLLKFHRNRTTQHGVVSDFSRAPCSLGLPMFLCVSVVCTFNCQVIFCCTTDLISFICLTIDG